MNNSVYQINKGINKAIEFRGLKAQYIAYLAGGLVSLLILFAVLYICKVTLMICLPLVLGCGTALFFSVNRLSHRYGQYGLMKRGARKSIPTYVRIKSRKVFTRLNHSSITKK